MLLHKSALYIPGSSIIPLQYLNLLSIHSLRRERYIGEEYPFRSWSNRLYITNRITRIIHTLNTLARKPLPCCCNTPYITSPSIRTAEEKEKALQIQTKQNGGYRDEEPPPTTQLNIHPLRIFPIYYILPYGVPCPPSPLLPPPYPYPYIALGGVPNLGRTLPFPCVFL